jgi:hypothetical protein
VPRRLPTGGGLAAAPADADLGAPSQKPPALTARVFIDWLVEILVPKF